jgi:hypothetical protein
VSDVRGGPPDSAIDIGCDHRITFASYQGETAGANVWHLTAAGTWCVGWSPFNGSAWAKMFGNQGWDVVQREPLTLSPSLLCRACQDHGFIREGHWVKA